MARCDLHMHTVYSDGKLSVDELIELAFYFDIHAISITDHDTLRGQQEAIKISREKGIEYITGVEVSTILNGKEVHILGYGIDLENRELLYFFEKMRKDRVQRTISILEKLEKYGISIDIEEFGSDYMEQNIGRPHIAQKMLDKGWIKKYEEAFQKYLYNNGPCYVPKMDIPPKEAVEYIHEAGGLAVLAHPGLMLNEPDIEGVIRAGIDGIEVYYPKHTEAQKHRFIEIARINDLLVTGGSDFHGREKDYEIMKENVVSYEIFERLRRRHDQRKFNEKIEYK